jgi:caffeoyl-CoA O-methyltransferase
MNHRMLLPVALLALSGIVVCSSECGAQIPPDTSARDARVRAFLESHTRQWRDMNIPETDGKTLYDLIVKHSYTKALEIGTSTGHSSIWIAWALSKTGGTLVTIEIDEDRFRMAKRNFEEAHELVPRLDGPFDFVFSDADKDWYTNYFLAVEPKLVIGGCYTTHNVFAGGRRSGWNAAYVEFLQGLPNFSTTFDDRGGGLSISIKTGER